MDSKKLAEALRNLSRLRWERGPYQDEADLLRDAAAACEEEEPYKCGLGYLADTIIGAAINASTTTEQARRTWIAHVASDGLHLHKGLAECDCPGLHRWTKDTEFVVTHLRPGERIVSGEGRIYVCGVCYQAVQDIYKNPGNHTHMGAPPDMWTAYCPDAPPRAEEPKNG